MLTLNIIPAYLKKEISLRQIYKTTAFFAALTLVLLCVFAMTVQAGIYLLQSHFIETIYMTDTAVRSKENPGNAIKTINTQLSTISGIQNEYVKWSLLLAELSANTSNGITLSQLSLNRDKNSIFMSGTARTRDDLLALKELLENSEHLSDVAFPLKNLLEKENIRFEISAKIKTYDFK